ncbi:hypothetical protein KIW84_032905 [Lathyrus oleraceus]|uniref:Retrovirus-related Pol polyprotein from transposon TNT 1-94 n=1 Tax=Pisum sativum TaxID=3888 RepID=A0A9D4XWK7_PEA|nr:hypothetical protein KIW84_032905 [Pisum sativum]
MVVQEESNNISVLSQLDSNFAIDEANRLVNAYDSRKFAGKSSNSYGGASNNKKDGRVCTFCHRTGHTIDVCYRRHGFPPNFTKKQTSTNASNAADTHNMMNTGTEGSLNNSSASITQEQYSQLIGLLQQTNLLPSNPTPNPSANHISTHFSHTPNENSGKLFVSTVSCSTYIKPDFWILDSGANDHVCSSLKLFSCYHKIQPISVCLPNGSVFLAKHAGTIQFSPHLQINNVLYTPDFSLNLVSVSKLCQSTNCKFIFSANDCFNQVEGLYRLRTDIDSIPAETSISSRALLYHSNLPKSYWSYAISYGAFIINRVNTPLLNNQSHYHILHNKPPDINQLKVFGSLCYASTLSNQRTKLDTRARKSLFLGYAVGYKGSILLDLNSFNIFISRNVTYHEQILPYQKQSSSTTPPWEYYSTSVSNPNLCHDIHHSAQNDLPINQLNLPATTTLSTPTTTDSNPPSSSLANSNPPTSNTQHSTRASTRVRTLPTFHSCPC